ncbi:hypothetical protein ATY81_28005 [Rhizobium sp. R72]|nr:hypothetical protein ATY79_29680 [Rhizobium sp. R693]OWV96077.1 hypothetical protein ATY81_28005 [Rhizobium sp. R72]OWV96083.1 hypothetical protein ATY80_28005 [Rhizobium sp. R711]
MPRGARKAAAVTLKISKNAIAAFSVKPVQLAFEKCFEIHHLLLLRSDRYRRLTWPYLILIKLPAFRVRNRSGPGIRSTCLLCEE